MYRAILPFCLLSILAFKQDSTDWFSVLGKTFAETEIIHLFGQYGDFDSNDFRADRETQLNWLDAGISVSMNDKGEIQKIYFFNEKYTSENNIYSRFKGKLPLDVNLNMTPKKVKKLLGAPSEEEGKVYKRLNYKTNFEYTFLFNTDVMQYMEISLMEKKED